MLVDPRWSGGVQRVLCPAPYHIPTQETHMRDTSFEPNQSFMDAMTAICASAHRNVDTIYGTFCIGEDGQPRNLNRIDPITDDHVYEAIRACERLSNLATAIRNIISNEVESDVFARSRFAYRASRGLNLDLKA
jgi:hypothetical protein